jgi:hypothetical protein
MCDVRCVMCDVSEGDKGRIGSLCHTCGLVVVRHQAEALNDILEAKAIIAPFYNKWSFR